MAEQAKNVIEDERDWEFLKKVDTSQSFNNGDSWQTAKTLPADFGTPMDSGIFVSTGDIIPYLQLPIEDRYRIQDNIAHRYIIDIANSQYYILGKPTAATIYFWYKRFTPVLNTSGNNPVWPVRFWPMIAIKMAKLFYPIDQGQKQAAWDDRWDIEYNIIHQNMVAWNERLRNIAYQNRYYKQREGSLVLYPDNPGRI